MPPPRGASSASSRLQQAQFPRDCAVVARKRMWQAAARVTAACMLVLVPVLRRRLALEHGIDKRMHQPPQLRIAHLVSPVVCGALLRLRRPRAQCHLQLSP